MSRTLVVDEAAVEEAEAQARYYWERAGEGVALRFAAEVEAIFHWRRERTVRRRQSPAGEFRVPLKRVFLDRFPFAVVFYVEADVVYVVALEALHKRPGYWRGRLPR